MIEDSLVNKNSEENEVKDVDFSHSIAFDTSLKVCSLRITKPLPSSEQERSMGIGEEEREGGG